MPQALFLLLENQYAPLRPGPGAGLAFSPNVHQVGKTLAILLNDLTEYPPRGDEPAGERSLGTEPWLPGSQHIEEMGRPHDRAAKFRGKTEKVIVARHQEVRAARQRQFEKRHIERASVFNEEMAEVVNRDQDDCSGFQSVGVVNGVRYSCRTRGVVHFWAHLGRTL